MVITPYGTGGVISSPSCVGVSVGSGVDSGVGVSTGTGVSVASGSGMISGVGVSVGGRATVGTSVGVGTLVAVPVGRGVGETNGRGVTVGMGGKGVKVAKAVGVAKGVRVLVGVRVGEGVPGVLVTVGVLVGSGVGVEVGTGVRVGLGGLVLTTVPGAAVSFNSGGSSSICPGSRVPSGVGVGMLRRGPPSLTVRLQAASSSVQRSATGASRFPARKPLPVEPREPLEVRDCDIYRTITHAQGGFNFAAGSAGRHVVT
jgi:hypothetical protein